MVVEFLKMYRGVLYRGVVNKVGWHSQKRFGAKVTCCDGYTEILPFPELEGMIRAGRSRWKKNTSGCSVSEGKHCQNKADCVEREQKPTIVNMELAQPEQL